MKGVARWQVAVHYLGEAAMFAGVLWSLYRILVLHACPTARFNDLSLIVLGLGLAIAPLHPFNPGAPYLSPLFRRSTVLAWMSWALAVSGVVYAVAAQWFRLPQYIWLISLLPATYYMWFGLTALGGMAKAERSTPGVQRQDEGSEVHDA